MIRTFSSAVLVDSTTMSAHRKITHQITTDLAPGHDPSAGPPRTIRLAIGLTSTTTIIMMMMMIDPYGIPFLIETQTGVHRFNSIWTMTLAAEQVISFCILLYWSFSLIWFTTAPSYSIMKKDTFLLMVFKKSKKTFFVLNSQSLPHSIDDMRLWWISIMCAGRLCVDFLSLFNGWISFKVL